MRQTFRVVQPIDTEDQLLVRPEPDFGACGVALAFLTVTSRFGERFNIDADGEGRDARARRAGPDRTVWGEGPGVAGAEEVQHVAHVALRVQPNQIVGVEPIDELPVARHRHKGLRRWNGDMEKEANPTFDAVRAQVTTERKEVVVLHPDRVIGFHVLGDHLRQPLVHVLVGLLVAGPDRQKVGTSVKQGPQNRVRVALVIVLLLFLRQIEG